MGYRGKVAQQAQARLLRADGMILQDIAQQLGVSKSSVSLWVRDVDFVPRPHVRARRREPNALQRRKQAEIEELSVEAATQIGRLSDREFLVAGAALYAGEGAKGDGVVLMANTNPHIIAFFCAWLRRFYDLDETRLRVQLYLHQVSTLTRNWILVGVDRIPPTQFGSPIGRFRTRPSGTRSILAESRRFATVAVGPTGASWVWCTRCSAARPFRGSSIGRAVAC